MSVAERWRRAIREFANVVRTPSTETSRSRRAGGSPVELTCFAGSGHTSNRSSGIPVVATSPSRTVGGVEDPPDAELSPTARCCGAGGHRQTNSVRVCSPASRRVAPLRPRYRGARSLDTGSAHARPGWLLPTMPNHDPLHVVVDDVSTFLHVPTTVDTDRQSGWNPQGASGARLVCSVIGPERECGIPRTIRLSVVIC